jgi:DtxR family Mn-dependent transcriptional regulator
MTASGQMYLKAVYYLSKQDESTYVADIAQALEVSRASASNALKSLAKRGYVAHKPYGDVKLTVQGKHAALVMVRVDERIRQYCYCE